MGNALFCTCNNKEINNEMLITKESGKMNLAKSNLKISNLRYNNSETQNFVVSSCFPFDSEQEKGKYRRTYAINSIKKIQKNFRKFIQNSSFRSKSNADTTSNLHISLIKVKQSFHSPPKKFYDINNTNIENKSKSLIFNPHEDSISYNQSNNFIHKKSVDLMNLSLISDDKLKINVNDENQIASYLGNKVNDSKEGFGIEISKDGSKFKGYFKNNKVNGWGFYTHSDGDIFTGQFTNDQAEGFGIFRNPSGANYVGFWMNNNQHGFGTDVMTDRSTYIGEYSRGKKNGYGCYNWADGSKYQGSWINNRTNGYGLYEFNDGKSYIGEWKDNVMNGYGEFSWQDGKKYLGFYLNDKKDGFGIFYWKSSNKFFVGFWKDGKQEGPGKIITEKKTKYGKWKDGNKVSSYFTEKETIDTFSPIQLSYVKLYSQSFLDLNKYLLSCN